MSSQQNTNKIAEEPTRSKKASNANKRRNRATHTTVKLFNDEIDCRECVVIWIYLARLAVRSWWLIWLADPYISPMDDTSWHASAKTLSRRSLLCVANTRPWSRRGAWRWWAVDGSAFVKASATSVLVGSNCKVTAESWIHSLNRKNFTSKCFEFFLRLSRLVISCADLLSTWMVLGECEWYHPMWAKIAR